jgi:DNA polymerase I
MVMPVLDNNTVYLIDGSGYIFRAYFAIRSLHTKSGIPTNAVYGFTNMLLKLMKEHHPCFLAIAFDQKEPTFRHKLYPEYKANRPLPPKDLIPQFSLIHQVVEAFNIKLLSMPGFEADDLIATIAKRARKEGHEVIIVTGDKDFMQLVDEDVFLLDELRAAKNGIEQFIDIKSVKEQLGVFPHEVIDLLALSGDASDNIPGVAGIGKKTAAELINEFGPLEKILKMTPLIKQKSRQKKLIDGYKLALLSKQLVTIDDNVPIEFSMADLKYSGIDQKKTKDLFSKLDFNRLLEDKKLFTEEIVKKKEVDRKIDHGTYLAITNYSDLKELKSKVSNIKKIALYAVTDTQDSTTANLIGLALAWEPNHAVYIPITHEKGQLDLKTVKAIIDDLFLDKEKILVAHNAKFHHKVLVRHGFSEFKIGGDPMLENYLLYQDQDQHNLGNLSIKYLDHQSISLEEICGNKKDHINISDVSLKKVVEYSAEKAVLTLQLEEILLRKINNDSLSKLYFELELPLEEVLSRMELVGVKIDTDVLKNAEHELKNRLRDLENKAHDSAGFTFNLASPKQVSEVLFNKLSLPPIRKTKTGFSTDSMVLEKLVGLHLLPSILLEHRMCAKLINTYIETLPLLINENTGRVHTSYNQFVTATGRLSCSDPNLQNIPIRTKEGRKIRQAFVAKPGYQLISLDYSQVELRILAYVSGDPVLLDAFAKDQDVHRRTASEIFDVVDSQVTKEQRDAAKTINFGILYGMGVHRLSQTLKISRKEAQIYLDKYFAKYSGVFRWKNEALLLAREKNQVRTLFGRIRNLPELSSKNNMEQARGERLAINTPIQGTAADIIKIAMIDTDQYLRSRNDDSHLIMQVHDELIVEARSEHAKDIASQVAKIMRHGHGLDLNLKVDFGIAKNWDQAH